LSYGEDLLRRLGAFEADSGMYANLGIRVTSVSERTVELVANPTAAAHGFPNPDGEIVHGGAVATIADCALACAAVTVAEEGELCTTADLRVEFFRPTLPGLPVTATGECRHRTRRLAYCSATLTQRGKVVAEARATIAYLRSERSPS
jgi:uncharacterized protein (TIGR00369 family)